MSLLRAASVPKSVVRYSLREFEAEARQRVEDARREAAEILATAQARAAELETAAREQARADGWRQGYEEGQQLGRAEALEQCGGDLRRSVAALAKLDESIESVRAELETAALGDVVKLAVAIAERVTKRAGLIDPAVLTENVREALKLAVRGGNVRVAIHPRQRELLATILPQVQGEWATPRAFEIVEDETVTPGGCRIFTNDGQIDADLQSQLDRLAVRLLPAACPGDGAAGPRGGGNA